MVGCVVPFSGAQETACGIAPSTGNDHSQLKHVSILEYLVHAVEIYLAYSSRCILDTTRLLVQTDNRYFFLCSCQTARTTQIPPAVSYAFRLSAVQ